MPHPKIPDGEFIALFESLGAGPMAKRLQMDLRGIYARRESIEKKIGRSLLSPNPHCTTRVKTEHPGRLHCEVENGVVLVGSDAHYWPGIVSAAHRAFVKFCKELQPKAVVMNGDMLDGAAISRHPPIGWENHPTVKEEIEAVQERLGEIQKAAFKAKRYWPLGNHDARFETRLATAAPEYARVNGVHLRDHFGADWEPCWSVWVNEDVVIKHRYKGGVHATHNNTLTAGKSTVTGHLHSLKVTPYTDYAGTRFGVDTGTMADPFGPQFEYQEDNPRNHRSGFAVLTFHRGRLLWPELVHVLSETEVEFRGTIVSV